MTVKDLSEGVELSFTIMIEPVMGEESGNGPDVPGSADLCFDVGPRPASPGPRAGENGGCRPADRRTLPLADRLVYHPEDHVVFVNLVGLRLLTAHDVRALAELLDQRLSALGGRVNGVVNYDNFKVSDDAAPGFFAMVRHNSERYFLS